MTTEKIKFKNKRDARTGLGNSNRGERQETKGKSLLIVGIPTQLCKVNHCSLYLLYFCVSFQKKYIFYVLGAGVCAC